ncbi:MAG TPA: VOC family protein [Acidimicrobiales bacterium]|nr:VOC family protein [Acidimicrobiales bacterium]
MAGSYSAGTDPVDDDVRARLTVERDRIRSTYLAPRDDRPASAARGVHHVALICSDVEETVRFYQEVLGFPLTTMFENRDLAGSTHFFFDLGAGNTIAFFDLPGVDPGDYAEVLGGLHHLAISIEVEHWKAAKARLDAAGVPYDHVDETSLYFRGPDGERLELIADPLRWMYGERVD